MRSRVLLLFVREQRADLGMHPPQLITEDLEHLHDDAGVLADKLLELGNCEHEYRRIRQHDRVLFARILSQRALHAEELTGLDVVVYLLPGLDVGGVEADAPRLEDIDLVAHIATEVYDRVGLEVHGTRHVIDSSREL